MSNREPGMYWVRKGDDIFLATWSAKCGYWVDTLGYYLFDYGTPLSETPIRLPVARRAEEMLELLEEFVSMCEGPSDYGLMERLYERANDLTYEIREESKEL